MGRSGCKSNGGVPWNRIPKIKGGIPLFIFGRVSHVECESGSIEWTYNLNGKCKGYYGKLTF